MKRFVDTYLDVNTPTKIVDIGSRDVNGTYADLFRCELWSYIGADLEAGENVDIVLPSAYDFSKFKSSSVDVVISGQAFEHIEFFWITMREIARILKSDALCCLIVPSRGYEHRHPVDCWRFLPDGLRALCRYADLDVVDVQYADSPCTIDEESKLWNDCVLIARKPRLKQPTRLLSRLRTLARGMKEQRVN